MSFSKKNSRLTGVKPLIHSPREFLTVIQNRVTKTYPKFVTLISENFEKRIEKIRMGSKKLIVISFWKKYQLFHYLSNNIFSPIFNDLSALFLCQINVIDIFDMEFRANQTFGSERTWHTSSLNKCRATLGVSIYRTRTSETECKFVSLFFHIIDTPSVVRCSELKST